MKELIEQIGGRERLEEIAADGFLKHGESKLMACALLAVLDAKPFAYIHPQMLSDLNDGARVCGRVWSNDIDELSHEKRLPIYTDTPAASVPEWSNAQCMEFLTVAFRHCEISGDIEMDDIRLGVKMANAAAPGPGGHGG